MYTYLRTMRVKLGKNIQIQANYFSHYFHQPDPLNERMKVLNSNFIY